MVEVTCPRWQPCPYMVKFLKIFFSRTQSHMILKLGMQHWGLKLYKVCINGNTGLTLTYFTARSNFGTKTFLKEKEKTIDFSENIAAYDLKVGRCKQLIELIKVYDIENQCHFLTLAHGHLHMKIKTHISQKPVGHFEPNFVCKLLGTKKLKYNDMMLVTLPR